MISADGAIIDNDIPRPERHSVPLDLVGSVSSDHGLASYLLHLKPLFAIRTSVRRATCFWISCCSLALA